MSGPRDAGLQPERTRLAWRRTALAATVVALLAVRLAALRGAPVAIAGTVLLWLAVLILSHRRITVLGPRAAGGREPLWLGAAVIGYAVLGLLLIFG